VRASRRHSQKAQRTELLGIRLFPDEKGAFKDFAEGEGIDMTVLAYEALAAAYPAIFAKNRVVA
jgi:LPS sulfotransferase NodH